MKTDEPAFEAAQESLKWWNSYYHFLLASHFILGLTGVIVGALIAADFDSYWFGLTTSTLGVISTVVVGIVSFVQPGRMASVFYDAYWRLRIGVLRYKDKSDGADHLLSELSNGYTTVATIQPEALKKHTGAVSRVLDLDGLSEDRRAALEALHRQLAEEEKAEAATEPSDGPLPPTPVPPKT
ncbi:MAG: hypothetical protein AAF367_04230 [Pseudomonadota bacterium]